MSFLSRLFLSRAPVLRGREWAAFALGTGLLAALPLAGCKPVVTGCEVPYSGGADLPDPSFEETPTQWTLAPHSTIDSDNGVCDGTRSLKLELDSGLGSLEVTRSGYFSGLQMGKEYEIGFHYRFENCNKAAVRLTIGNYDKRLVFDGSEGAWKDTSLVVKFATEPAWIDINPERSGAASDYQGPAFDNNLMWIDNFTIKDVAGSN